MMKKIIPLALALAVAITGFSITLPLIPFLVIELGGNLFQASAAAGVFSIASVFTSPLWGKLSDKIGRKSVLLISSFISIFTYYWLANATSIHEVFLARIFAGLTTGWMVAGQAYIADVTMDKDRVKGMGMYGAAFGLGFTFGPFLVFQLYDVLGMQSMFYISVVLHGVAFLILLIFLKEPEHKKELILPAKLLEIMKKPPLRKGFLLYFLIIFIFAGAESTMALWGGILFNFTAQNMGVLLSIAGVISVIIQGGLIGKLNEKLGRDRLLLLSSFFLFLGFYLFIIADHAYFAYAIIVCLSIGLSLASPSILAFISQHAPDNTRGKVMGLGQSVQGIARGIGTSFFGLILQYGGLTAPYYCAIAFLLIAIYMIFRMRQFTNKT